MSLALAAGITGVAGLLSGILSGKQKEKEREWSFEDWKKKRKQMISDLKSSDLKPKTPYYAIESSLPGFDELVKRVVAGQVKERLGERLGDYGVDYEALSSSLFPSEQQAQQQQTPQINPEQYQQLLNELRMRPRNPMMERGMMYGY